MTRELDIARAKECGAVIARTGIVFNSLEAFDSYTARIRALAMEDAAKIADIETYGGVVGPLIRAAIKEGKHD